MKNDISNKELEMSINCLRLQIEAIKKLMKELKKYERQTTKRFSKDEEQILLEILTRKTIMNNLIPIRCQVCGEDDLVKNWQALICNKCYEEKITNRKSGKDNPVPDNGLQKEKQRNVLRVLHKVSDPE